MSAHLPGELQVVDVDLLTGLLVARGGDNPAAEVTLQVLQGLTIVQIFWIVGKDSQRTKIGDGDQGSLKSLNWDKSIAARTSDGIDPLIKRIGKRLRAGLEEITDRLGLDIPSGVLWKIQIQKNLSNALSEGVFHLVDMLEVVKEFLWVASGLHHRANRTSKDVLPHWSELVQVDFSEVVGMNSNDFLGEFVEMFIVFVYVRHFDPSVLTA